MNLSDVSWTAIWTLICRVTQAERKNSIIHDPMGAICLENILASASQAERKRIGKWRKLMAGWGSIGARKIARRTVIIDDIVNEYIGRHPSCTVVSLGCGFDTRFWRIDSDSCRYIELDVPSSMELKKRLLKDHITYENIGCSVLDTRWIDTVTSNENDNVLLIAEGLFMYLPEPEAKRVLQEISRRFTRSQIVLDMVPRKFTRGIWRKLAARKFKFFLGLEASFVFGLRKARDIESYGSGFKLIDDRGFRGLFIITASIDGNGK
jgi:O-methyltransferase involved in polyketide biosynthesis